jgi:DNA-binding transcriptional regulator YiaG
MNQVAGSGCRTLRQVFLAWQMTDTVNLAVRGGHSDQIYGWDGRVTSMATSLSDEVRLLVPREARRIRKSAGVTQARLAAELGITRVSVYRYEAGDRSPRGDRRTAYARLLADLEQVTEASR